MDKYKIASTAIRVAQKSILGHTGCLKDSVFDSLVREIVDLGVPPSGFVRYVYETRGDGFHPRSIFNKPILTKYVVYCKEATLAMHDRISNVLTTFETKRKYMSLDRLLVGPRHDINSVVRWCLAKRHGIVTMNQKELLQMVMTDLACFPWYNQCLDVLPELAELGVGSGD